MASDMTRLSLPRSYRPVCCVAAVVIIQVPLGYSLGAYAYSFKVRYYYDYPDNGRRDIGCIISTLCIWILFRMA